MELRKTHINRGVWGNTSKARSPARHGRKSSDRWSKAAAESPFLRNPFGRRTALNLTFGPESYLVSVELDEQDGHLVVFEHRFHLVAEGSPRDHAGRTCGHCRRLPLAAGTCRPQQDFGAGDVLEFRMPTEQQSQSKNSLARIF